MSHSLASLPTELLRSILSIEDRPSALINLFLCGNVPLQHKIAASVTHLSLRSPGLFENRRLPSCLTFMRNLRELSLEIPSLMLYCPFDIFVTIRGLSPTLKKLEIRFIKTWLKEEDPTDPYDDSPLDSEPSLFFDKLVEPLVTALEGRTGLEALHIHTRAFFRAADIQRLPSSLTELTIRLPAHANATTAAAEALPRGLTRLGVTNGFRIEPFVAEFFAALPRQLAWFEIQGFRQVLTLAMAQRLPPSLRHAPSLQFRLTRSASATHPLSISHALLKLPLHTDFLRVVSDSLPYLVELKLEGEQNMDCHFISTLPRTLTSFHGPLDMATMKRAVWPPHITSLKTHSTDGLTPVIAASLPPSLRTLGFQVVSFAVNGALVSALPRSITDLSLDVVAPGEEIEFPPSLTSFMSVRYRVELNRLPKNLIHCHLPFTSLKAASVAGLPHSLKTLSVSRLQLDHVPQDHLPAVAALYDAHNAEHGFSESHPLFASLPSSSTLNLFDLLPRSLETLEFQHSSTLDKLSPADWSRLPHLTRLRVTGEISEDIILHLPSKRMADLAICTPRLRDEHIAALPRKLTRLSHYMPENALSDACIADIPTDVFYLSLPDPHWLMSMALRKRRFRAFCCEDPSELKRLLNPASITANDLEPVTNEKATT